MPGHRGHKNVPPHRRQKFSDNRIAFRHPVNIKLILEVFMEEKIRQFRILAVQRFKAGESPESIFTSLGKSRSWLYKWISRFDEGSSSWFEDHSRRPQKPSNHTPFEIEEIVKMIRLNLYRKTGDSHLISEA